MSTILEALRKAESDRYSAAAPILNAPVARFLEPTQQARWRTRWPWAALPPVVIACAWLAWPDAKPERKAENGTQVEVPALILTSPVAPVTVAPVTIAPGETKSEAAPAVRKAEKKTGPKETIEKPRPAKTERKIARVEPAKKPVQPSEAARAKRAAPAISAIAATPATLEEPPLPTLRELPAHIQRSVPKFELSGYMYSADPSSRSLLIGRRLLHEGDEITPGLVLESMTPSGMVLNHNGHRYRAPY